MEYIRFDGKPSVLVCQGYRGDGGVPTRRPVSYMGTGKPTQLFSVGEPKLSSLDSGGWTFVHYEGNGISVVTPLPLSGHLSILYLWSPALFCEKYLF
ncbi:MAG: hypothetical protein ACFFBD_04375 [Candidatus Hodarchaeota archaeon]